MEPGSSVSRFRHYVGAVSGWQCSGEERGSLRVLPAFELLLVREWYSRLSGSRAESGGPPAVRWLAKVNHNRLQLNRDLHVAKSLDEYF